MKRYTTLSMFYIPLLLLQTGQTHTHTQQSSFNNKTLSMLSSWVHSLNWSQSLSLCLLSRDTPHVTSQGAHCVQPVHWTVPRNKRDRVNICATRKVALIKLMKMWARNYFLWLFGVISYKYFKFSNLNLQMDILDLRSIKSIFDGFGWTNSKPYEFRMDLDL